MRGLRSHDSAMQAIAMGNFVDGLSLPDHCKDVWHKNQPLTVAGGQPYYHRTAPTSLKQATSMIIEKLKKGEFNAMGSTLGFAESGVSCCLNPYLHLV